MKRMRIYFDTSVLGGCFDREFQDASRQLVQAAYAEQILPLLSEILLRELPDETA